MHVARPGADGAVSFSNGAGVVELAEEGEHGQHPGPVAFVFLPNATVTLAGSAVTQASAAAIARALRPL
jgi:hypothetical protein